MSEVKQSRTLSPQMSVVVIDALGGSAKTSRICKCSTAAVSQWKTSGIPAPRIQFLREKFKDLAVMKTAEVMNF